MPGKKKQITKMSKKQAKKTPKDNSSLGGDDLHRKLLEALKSSPLNGGFDTLLHKVDQIEQCQGVMDKKVDKINQALYDPDDGLFSRIQALGSAQNTHIVQMRQWSETIEKELEENKSNDHERQSRIETVDRNFFTLQNSVDSIEKTRKTIVAGFKWFIVAVVGGVISLVLKSMWVFF